MVLSEAEIDIKITLCPKSGKVKSERHIIFNNFSGKEDMFCLHREGAPALKEWHCEGWDQDVKYFLEREEWWNLGKLHRENSPAIIMWYENGTPREESYYLNNELHREGKPAFIDYRKDGTIQTMIYYRNGLKHREDGPAMVNLRADGSVKRSRWYYADKTHREDGPAFEVSNRFSITGSDKVEETFKYSFVWEGVGCTFWELYEKADDTSKKTLMREWFHSKEKDLK